MNENIKYCRKPIFTPFDEPLRKLEKKRMKCLSGKASGCHKEFLTTKEDRICPRCIEVLNKGNYT